jgi:hypothetical protein
MMSCEQKCKCECCVGVEVLTPALIYNRPGLDTLAYRIGVHGAFLETMKARLSSRDFPALARLGSRTADDPSIAFLDAWATVADVLTFYEERLVNEGYLRTATERRSVLELARLIGYEPRPGVAATVYLSYEIDKNAAAPVEIPSGSRVQSLPGPGEQSQTFETIDKIVARKEWNAISPRLERPNSIARLLYGTDEDPGARVYLAGTATGLKAGDGLLIQFVRSVLLPCRVSEVVADSAADRTLVRLSKWDGSELLAPSVLQVHRALLKWQRAPAPTSSMGAEFLAAVIEFLLWFNEQANASPGDPDVQKVLSRTDVVNHIVSTVDALQKALLAGISDKALALVILPLISNIAGLSGYISEMTDSSAGPVGKATDALADELKTIAGKDPGPGRDKISVLLQRVVSKLAIARSVPPRNSQSLIRDPATLFNVNSDVGTQAVAALAPSIATQLATAVRNAGVSAEVPIRVYAFRSRGLLFGSSAPPKVTSVNRDTGVASTSEWTDADISNAESTVDIYLDTPNDKIQPGGWVALDYSAINPFALGGIELPASVDGVLIAKVNSIDAKVARADYGMSGQTTRIGLYESADDQPLQWYTYTAPGGEGPKTTPAFQLIRRLAVYSQTEELPLGMEPISDEICGGDQWIETDDLYTGLETGRWLVVSGERSDVNGTEGVRGSELVMLDAVQQYVAQYNAPANGDAPGLAGRAGNVLSTLYAFEPGERLHTFLKLATPLSYCYKRSTVAINANVAKATHGETRNETLGSGDASMSLQSFTLRQPPLTYVPANEPDGTDSTLHVYVNSVEWNEAPAMVALGPGDRGFVTRTDDDSNTSIVFGNGQYGARVPTGVANVTAVYRNGIGRAGNVKAGQITNLLSRPLGVKGVNNPIEAAGGADKETRDQARKNAPLAVKALDRLVGVQDYADFSRTFAGIAKAQSAMMGSTIYVTIAGVDDIDIPKSSDLYRNLIAALRTYGDASVPVQVDLRELLMLVLSARLAIDPNYRWEDVVDRVRTYLLNRYSFERQELGQPVVLSEVIATIQSQRGVRYVDVDALGAVSQLNDDGELRSPQQIADALKEVIDNATAKGRPNNAVLVRGIRSGKNAVLPAQLAFFVPALPESLILNQVEEPR